MSYLASRLAVMRTKSMRLAATTAPALRMTAAAPVATVGLRSFQTGRRAALKESREMEGVEHEIEHHKQDQLKKKEEGKNHWKEELASDSESMVKADRNEGMSAAEEIAKLQEKTVEKMKPQSGRETMH